MIIFSCRSLLSGERYPAGRIVSQRSDRCVEMHSIGRGIGHHSINVGPSFMFQSKPCGTLRDRVDQVVVPPGPVSISATVDGYLGSYIKRTKVRIGNSKKH